MLRRLLVNTSSNMVTLMVKLTITFIMTPVLVHNLGAYDYGLWEIIGSLVGYAGLLHFGIRPAISRYAAKLRAEGDEAGLRMVYACGIVFLGVVGATLATFFWLWGVWFPGTLAPEGEAEQRYTLLLLIVGAQILIIFPGHVAESYLEGFHKYYLKNNLTLFNSIVGAFVVYKNITPENGILLLAGVNAVGLSLKYILFFWILSRPSMGAVFFRLRFFCWAKLRELLYFGGKTFVSGLAGRVNTKSDALIIGAFLGPATVPLYSIPANLIMHMRGVGFTLAHAFMPLFSDLNARHDVSTARSYFLFGSKIVVAIILPMGVGLALVGAPFLEIWIGPEVSEYADVIVPLLAIYGLAPLLDPLGRGYLTALDEHGIVAKLMPIGAVLNVALSIILIHPFGLVGVALGSLIPSYLFWPIFLRKECRLLELSVWYYLKTVIGSALMASLVMMGAVMWYRANVDISTYLELLGAVALGAVVYAAVYSVLFVSRDERDFIMARIRPRMRRG